MGAVSQVCAGGEDFGSLAGFRVWFERVRWAIDPDGARAELEAALAALGRHPLLPDAQFHALEMMQEAVGYVARSAGAEVGAIANLLAGNAALYARLAADASTDLQRAVDLHQRVVQSHALAIVEHFRRHCPVAPGRWAALNGAYARAEAEGLAHLSPTACRMLSEARCNARALYGAALLVALAAPLGEARERFAVVERCALRFARHLDLVSDEVSCTAAFGVDLDGDAGPNLLQELARGTGRVRAIETRTLAAELRRVSERLRDGLAADVLGLAPGRGRGTLQAVLATVTRSWIARTDRRPEPRRETCLRGQLVIGFEAVLGALADADVAQQTAHPVEIADEPDHAPAASIQYPATVATSRRDALDCDILDESDSGMRVLLDAHATTLQRHALFAAWVQGGGAAVVGRIAWIMASGPSGAGRVCLGLRKFRGMPAAGRVVRQADATDTGGSPDSPAILLTGPPGTEQAAALILPRGVSSAARFVDLRLPTGLATLKVQRLLTVGADFQRLRVNRLPRVDGGSTAK